MGYREGVRLLLLLASSLIAAEFAQGQLKPGVMRLGVVVEAVSPHSEAEKAGIEAADVLLNWSRGDEKGEIISPFDLSLIEIEQAPQGKVTLEGMRGAERRKWEMGAGDWGLEMRPDFPPDILPGYLKARELAKAGNWNDAMKQWRIAAIKAKKSSQAWLSVWLFFHSAEQLTAARKWKEADAEYQQAIQEVSGVAPSITALLFRAWAAQYEGRDNWKHAEECYRQAITESDKLEEPLLGAALVDRLSAVLRIESELHKAEEYGRLALAVQEKLAPGSMPFARTLTTLGLIDLSAGDFTGADDFERQALAIQQGLSPETRTVATTLFYLGVIARYRGDLAGSEQYLQQALALQQKLVPDTLELSSTLLNLGNVAEAQGDVVQAEKYYLMALAIRERLAPNSMSAASALECLGIVFSDRGDLARAERYLMDSLAIHQKLMPGSLPEAAVWQNLSYVTQQRGDDVSTERYLRRALAIQERLAPNSLETPNTLDPLGDLARKHGDLAKAEDYYNRALVIRRKQAPDTLYINSSLSRLGDLARDRGDLKKAEDYYRQGLQITEKRGPDSSYHAELQAALAGVLRSQGQLDEATHLYEKALDVLENQITILGGTEEVRSNFRARYANFYKDYIDLLLTEKNSDQAFRVLERWHAHTLLETLSAAHVDIHKGVDPSLIDKERKLQHAFTTKSQIRIQLLSDKHTEEQLIELDKEIKDVLDQYHDVEQQIRASSPSYAALIHPHPLDVKQVQEQLLDASTVLLEYSLGTDHSYVFVVAPDSLAAYELPKQTEIESRAKSLYKLVTAATSSSSRQTRGSVRKNREAHLNQALSAMSEMLLEPVASQIQRKRLLVVSDGALQYIPFAMLPVPAESDSDKTSSQRNVVPLVVEHEIVNLPSASVLAVLRRDALGHQEAPKAVMVIADPVFDKRDERVKTALRMQAPKQEPTPGFETESAMLSAERLSRSVADITGRRSAAAYLSRLPFSRREAQAILEATPAGECRQALDFDASRATATDPSLAQYRIVHFATHGLLDSNHPELSGLVLSLVDKDGKKVDGLLGLEDIYNMNLPAELVVLSACETGLGEEIQGEGLLGLTRGFMYAGATRVVASLWSVDDAATAELMGRFYRAMEKEGKRPAAALREAQIETWKERRWSDPYYWAGFQLQGEWK